MQHLAVKVNSTRRGSYWGSSMWISTQQVNYWQYILHFWLTINAFRPSILIMCATEYV